MRRLWQVGLLIVFAGLIAHAQETTKQSSDSWIRFESRVGQFTVLLPQMPSQKLDAHQSNAGPYTTHLFTTQLKNTVFVVVWVDYDKKFKFGAQNELNANRDQFIKEIKGTLVSSKETTFDGHQSLEFTAETSDTIYRSRVVIVGRRPYQVFTGTTKGIDDSANITRFFESFKITQPPHQ
jgi:hypothetical protein